MSTETLPAKPAKKDLADHVRSDAFAGQLKMCLAKHMSPERYQRIVLTAIQRNPKISECSRESVFTALLTCAQLGLEPDGRTAHLIPYGSICQLIVDYKGLVELAMRSGLVSTIFAEAVCDKDQFKWLNGEVTHEINFREDRGEPYAFYAKAVMKDGATMTAVMSRADINEIRAKSRSGNAGPWKDHTTEMSKKTVLRRLSKMLVLSPEFRQAEAAEDECDMPITKPLVVVTDDPPVAALEEGAATQGGYA
jgi:recombination protein RecT